MINNWKKSELMWLIISAILVVGTAIWDKATPIELLTGIIGVVYVVMVAKGYNISNLLGIIYVGIYGILAWEAKFYGDTLMNVILVPLYLVAYFTWKKHTQDNGLVEARNLTGQQTAMLGVVIIVGILAFNFALSYMGGNYPLADSANSILTVAAMILTIQRYSQQWICWLTNNIISTVMWVIGIASGAVDISISIAVLKTVILINSAWGLANWYLRGKENN